jgi:hypothetical protein
MKRVIFLLAAALLSSCAHETGGSGQRNDESKLSQVTMVATGRHRGKQSSQSSGVASEGQIIRPNTGSSRSIPAVSLRRYTALRRASHPTFPFIE